MATVRVQKQDSSGAQTWYRDEPMPSTTDRQQRFFGAEYGRKKRGEATETGMNVDKLREFAKSRKSGRKSRRGRRR